jgi:hypothetical protein
MLHFYVRTYLLEGSDLRFASDCIDLWHGYRQQALLDWMEKCLKEEANLCQPVGPLQRKDGSATAGQPPHRTHSSGLLEPFYLLDS